MNIPKAPERWIRFGIPGDPHPLAMIESRAYLEWTRAFQPIIRITHRSREVQARWDYYGGLCWMCRAPAEAIDHVKPVSRGGLSIPANLRPACKSCNSRKGARWPL